MINRSVVQGDAFPMTSSSENPVINIRAIGYGYETTLDELLSKLETDADFGLKSVDAVNRITDLGPNEIITPKPSVWKIYLAPLFDLLIRVYLIMIFFMLILSLWVTGIASEITIWVVMISFNMVLAIFQQFRAQKKIDSLLKLSPPKAQVIRDGVSNEILASQLVPGDVIELSIGDKIPADARLVHSSNLMVNEASLTGESVPVEKSPDGSKIIKLETPISQHKTMVYMGTYIQTGRGKAVVVRTGNNTELGKIASAMSEMHTLEIPLRNRINAFGKRLTIVMLIFLLLKIIMSIISQLENDKFDFQLFSEDVARSILVAMSVIPINIPLLVTVVLISGVLNMAVKRVIVKELSVVETLGRCSVLCSDKTGTITLSKMSVKLLWDTQHYYGITLDEEYQHKINHIDAKSLNNFLDDGSEDYEALEKIVAGSPLELVLTTAVLNNDAKLVTNTKETNIPAPDYQVIGNPTDGALLVLALAQGFNEEDIKNRYLDYKSYPFDSTLKRMSGLFKDAIENDFMVLSKGATEVILPLCTQIGDEKNLEPLLEEDRQLIQSKVNHFAEEGYRVISLAYRAIDEIPDLFSENGTEREYLEQNLTYIGFAVIHDPPRPGVKNAVDTLDDAGIFPIMITGDSPSTAGTIARQVGILDPDEIVVEGREASKLDDERFFKVSVFARVSPQDKEIIVSRYQNRGDVVAMTGDGINDALAITRSDAGVAMGLTGTDVTKESADIIIADDSYISLVSGVREGRNLYEKIRIMIFFYLAINLSEGFIYFAASMFTDFYLINSWQRIYIFSIIHAFPVLAIIFGPSDRNIMSLKPRDNDDIIPRQLFYMMIIFIVSYVMSLIFIYFITYSGILAVNSVNTSGIGGSLEFANPSYPDYAEGMKQAKARTMMISVMYLTESFIVFSIRRINSNIFYGLFKDSSPLVWIIVLLGPIIHFSILFLQPFQETLSDYGLIIQIIPLSLVDLIIVIFVSLVPLLFIELFKWNRRDQNIQF
ncbi:MAG: cation-translocating P-type ATPase [Candidatus Kariarchaeaceae archaeon]|jgi:Ca2+-transporting ATPase